MVQPKSRRQDIQNIKTIAIIEKGKEAIQRLESVKNLIKGFETPYGMELLSTVHWIANEFPEAARDPEIFVEKVQERSTRKKFKMKP